MWCTNMLEVEGSQEDLERFRSDMRTYRKRPNGERVEIPLYFGRLLPRPEFLDGVEESSVGLRGYQALYGDWKTLLKVRWIKQAGVRDRSSLIRYLEQIDPNHFYLAQRYRANEVQCGFRNWYAWNMEHYGTKSDLDESTKVEEQFDEQGKLKQLIYTFQTWETPPLPWLELAQASYPKLTLRLTHRNPWKLAAEAPVPLGFFNPFI